MDVVKKHRMTPKALEKTPREAVEPPKGKKAERKAKNNGGNHSRIKNLLFVSLASLLDLLSKKSDPKFMVEFGHSFL